MVMVFYSIIMLEEKKCKPLWSLVLMYVVVLLRGKVMYKKTSYTPRNYPLLRFMRLDDRASRSVLLRAFFLLNCALTSS